MITFGMRGPAEELTHSELRLLDRGGWVLFLAHQPAKRLVVFVHGFRGGPVASWRQFPLAGQRSDWWRTADLLFVGYASERDNILGVSNRLRQTLPEFYPSLPDELLGPGRGPLVRPPSGKYEELVLAGHSLGGVIVRRLLCDAAEQWLAELEADPNAPRPPILDASVRLFSPASAGFRPGGSLGMLRALPLWTYINVYLRRSTAYTDLQPSSVFLRETKSRTEAVLVGSRASELKALRAEILWANPDEVVLTERYTSDRPDRSADDTTHRSVCKPDDAYELPWDFVEGA